ncbi:MAG: tRNA (cytidine(34)-2'-O)-methyltransferase [Bacillota bacterium]
MFHIVLYEPEIPQNTGNIARTCAATDSILHLVKPLGFRLQDRYLKRAGLDYWEHVEVRVHRDFEAVLSCLHPASFYFFTTKAGICYHEKAYQPGDALVFGPETRGLPDGILHAYPGRLLKIPQKKQVRSLNLANAVGIVLYEALRQQGFGGLV